MHLNHIGKCVERAGADPVFIRNGYRDTARGERWRSATVTRVGAVPDGSPGSLGRDDGIGHRDGRTGTCNGPGAVAGSERVARVGAGAGGWNAGDIQLSIGHVGEVYSRRPQEYPHMDSGIRFVQGVFDTRPRCDVHRNRSGGNNVEGFRRPSCRHGNLLRGIRGG